MDYLEIPENHNLYIIKSSNDSGDIYKFGYSSKIKNRVKTYYSHNPLTKILYTFYLEDAKNIELKIHKSFKSEYYQEWYNKETINLILQELLKNSDMLYKVYESKHSVDLSRYDNLSEFECIEVVEEHVGDMWVISTYYTELNLELNKKKAKSKIFKDCSYIQKKYMIVYYLNCILIDKYKNNSQNQRTLEFEGFVDYLYNQAKSYDYESVIANKVTYWDRKSYYE